MSIAALLVGVLIGALCGVSLHRWWLRDLDEWRRIQPDSDENDGAC